MQRILSSGTVVAVFSTILFSASPALAYLDPGTTGMILQAIIGGVIGGLVMIKVYWSKLKEFFSKSSPAQDQNSSSQSEDS